MGKETSLGHLEMLARRTKGLASEILQATTDALVEMNTVKADKENAVSITIPVTGWNSDSTANYPYYYDITVAGITTNDGANIAIAVSSLYDASECGLCPTNETLTNKVRIRASSIPTAAMSADLWIRRGEVEE